MADNGGLADALVRDAAPVKLALDARGSVVFVQAELGIAVEFPPQCDELVAKLLALFSQGVHGKFPFLSLGRDLFAQGFETVQRVGERFVLLGEVQADEVVDRLTEKARARHRAHADLACKVLAELKIALVAELRDVEHHVVSALGVIVDDLEVVKAL